MVHSDRRGSTVWPRDASERCRRDGRLDPTRRDVVFNSASGLLAVRRVDTGYIMDFPVRRCSAAEPPDGLAALGATLAETVWDGFNFLVGLTSPDAVRSLSPDLPAISRMPCAGIIVTALGDGDHHCVSRYFAPGKGIPEDRSPVARTARWHPLGRASGENRAPGVSSLSARRRVDLPASRRPRGARGILRVLYGGGGTMVSSHAGSCHSGSVRFTVKHDPDELTTCDCSLCVKRNALMAKIPEAALRIDAGEDLLTLYEWNTNALSTISAAAAASTSSTASGPRPIILV